MPLNIIKKPVEGALILSDDEYFPASYEMIRNLYQFWKSLNQHSYSFDLALQREKFTSSPNSLFMSVELCRNLLTEYIKAPLDSELSLKPLSFRFRRSEAITTSILVSPLLQQDLRDAYFAENNEFFGQECFEGKELTLKTYPVLDQISSILKKEHGVDQVIIATDYFAQFNSSVTLQLLKFLEGENIALKECNIPRLLSLCNILNSYYLPKGFGELEIITPGAFN